jgi:hypothetical protein
VWRALLARPKFRPESRRVLPVSFAPFAISVQLVLSGRSCRHFLAAWSQRLHQLHSRLRESCRAAVCLHSVLAGPLRASQRHAFVCQLRCGSLLRPGIHYLPTLPGRRFCAGGRAIERAEPWIMSGAYAAWIHHGDGGVGGVCALPSRRGPAQVGPVILRSLRSRQVFPGPSQRLHQLLGRLRQPGAATGPL